MNRTERKRGPKKIHKDREKDGKKKEIQRWRERGLEKRYTELDKKVGRNIDTEMERGLWLKGLRDGEKAD
jgi:hypothetical protein